MATYYDKNTAMVIFAKGDVAEQMENVNSTAPITNPITENAPMNVLPNGKKEPKANLGTLSKATVGLAVLRAGKSVVNYYKNNYGQIHQDSLAQAQINEAFSVIGLGASIGAGLAFGGVYGGLASLISNGVSIGLQEWTYQRMVNRSQTSSDIMFARVGLASINGGR